MPNKQSKDSGEVGSGQCGSCVEKAKHAIVLAITRDSEILNIRIIVTNHKNSIGSDYPEPGPRFIPFEFSIHVFLEMEGTLISGVYDLKYLSHQYFPPITHDTPTALAF